MHCLQETEVGATGGKALAPPAAAMGRRCSQERAPIRQAWVQAYSAKETPSGMSHASMNALVRVALITELLCLHQPVVFIFQWTAIGLSGEWTIAPLPAGRELL